MLINNKRDSFGNVYRIGEITLSRNTTLKKGVPSVYMEIQNGYDTSINSTDIDELIMVLLAIKREYETGEEIKWQESEN